MNEHHAGQGQETVWDRIYQSGGYGEAAPDPELVRLCAPLPRGKALDVGAGEGRHALWLAAQGYNVEAIDISREGVRRLEKETGRLGLKVRCVVAGAADHEFGQKQYDLVISTGCALNFFKKARAKEIIARLKAAVTPAGHIYVTLSTVEDPSYQRHRGRARQVEDDSFFDDGMGSWVNAFRPGELRACFPDFHVQDYHEREVHDTHGKPHTHMTAFLAAERRPDNAVV